MNEIEFQALVTKLGPEVAAAIKKEMDQYDIKMKAFAEEVIAKKGEGVSVKVFEEYKTASQEMVAKLQAIAEKQSTTIAEMLAKGESSESTGKSISAVLTKDYEDLRKIYSQGMGNKTYMVTMNKNGLYEMRPFDTSKAVGPNATVDGVVSGAVASITQSLDAATLLRMGGGAGIVGGQYRNTPWIFDLVNTVHASFSGAMPFAVWFDELAKVGSSATVAEGATKPLVQYLYELHSATYKKEAALIGFTQEFSMDFAQLESDIMNKGRIDVINRVNTAILPNIIAAATAYNTGTQFQGGVAVDHVNDFDAIAAMAAQSENAMYGASANAAIMSTFKKYRMGVTKETTGGYLNTPDIIKPISFVGNPAVGTDDVIVGDFKQYNVILRGGLIVKVGYNGTDFAENKYSVVMEQFYYDYISTVRKVAIVKGPDFATVKEAIGS